MTKKEIKEKAFEEIKICVELANQLYQTARKEADINNKNTALELCANYTAEARRIATFLQHLGLISEKTRRTISNEILNGAHS